MKSIKCFISIQVGFIQAVFLSVVYLMVTIAAIHVIQYLVYLFIEANLGCVFCNKYKQSYKKYIFFKNINTYLNHIIYLLQSQFKLWYPFYHLRISSLTNIYLILPWSS